MVNSMLCAFYHGNLCPIDCSHPWTVACHTQEKVKRASVHSLSPGCFVGLGTVLSLSQHPQRRIPQALRGTCDPLTSKLRNPRGFLLSV